MTHELDAPVSRRQAAPSGRVATSSPCKICGRHCTSRIVIAREMMLGLGDEFEYRECSGCGCLQLREPPADMARYYPLTYYSFQPPQQSSVRRWLKNVRIRHLFGRRTALGSLLVRRFGVPPDVAAVLRSGARFGDAILDVGCGDGRLLRELATGGFTAVSGIDPHIPHDVHYPCGVLVRRATLEDISGTFDLIMMHHAFEHVRDPEEALRQVNRLLSPAGRALLRFPLADSYAWRHYRTNWVQLDAPRHSFLHTRRSFGILAERTGFRVVSVEYDSTAFQFWGSEQYRQGLALRGDDCAGEGPRWGAFSRKQLREFARRAEDLNRRQEGDQAAFLLEKRA